MSEINTEGKGKGKDILQWYSQNGPSKQDKEYICIKFWEANWKFGSSILKQKEWHSSLDMYPVDLHAVSWEPLKQFRKHNVHIIWLVMNLGHGLEWLVPPGWQQDRKV